MNKLNEANLALQKAEKRAGYLAGSERDDLDILHDLEYNQNEDEVLAKPARRFCRDKFKNKSNSVHGENDIGSKKNDKSKKKKVQSAGDRYWQILGREVAEKRIKHQKIQFKQYKFKDEDKKGYYKQIVEEIESSHFKPLSSTPAYLVDYTMSKRTGQQFIRAVLTQKYHKNSIYFVSIKWIEIFAQAWNKDNETPEFASMGQTLLDVFIGDCEDEFFRGLDDFLKHDQGTFFFKRQRSQNADGLGTYKFDLYFYDLKHLAAEKTEADEEDHQHHHHHHEDGAGANSSEEG